MFQGALESISTVNVSESKSTCDLSQLPEVSCSSALFINDMFNHSLVFNLGVGGWRAVCTEPVAFVLPVLHQVSSDAVFA